MALSDLAQLAMLFEEHRPKLRAMVEQRLSSQLAVKGGPDDILQEAFLRAQKRWDQFPSTGMAGYPWLYCIVLDCLLDNRDRWLALRRDVRIESSYPDRSSEQFVLGLVNPTTGPSGRAMQREWLQRMCDRLKEVLTILKPEDHNLVCMRHYDDLKFKDIAAVLGMREGAVRVRYVRAMERLRQQWIARYGSEDLTS